jgi:AraC family transcriptional regulator
MRTVVKARRRYHSRRVSGRPEAHLPAFTAIFNPSGVVHTAPVGQTGARLFTIECRSQFLEQLDVRLPDHPVENPGPGAMLWPGTRLYSAFKARTTDPLVLESHLTEMLGGIAGSRLGDTRPRWFHRVKDRLHSQFRESIKVCDLAAEAGVHPVRLARVFRAQERQTPGDYVQRLRVRAACDLLGPGPVLGQGGRRLRVLGPEPFHADVQEAQGRDARGLPPGVPGLGAVCALNVAFRPQSALNLR